MRNKPGKAMRSLQQSRAQSFTPSERMSDSDWDTYLDEWTDYVEDPDSPLYDVPGDLAPEDYNLDIEEGRRDSDE